MKDNLDLRTKEAIRNLLLALKYEHPEILRDGGDICSDESKGFLISISKQSVVFESNREKEFFKSPTISALGPGTPCPNCGGTGKV